MSKSTRIATVIGIFTATSVSAQISCPPMPDAVTERTRDIKSEVTASIGSLAKIKAGEVTAKTEVTANALLARFPNVDRLLAVQTMAATYCQMLARSSLKDADRLDRWERFQAGVLNFQARPIPPRKRAEIESPPNKAAEVFKPAVAAPNQASSAPSVLPRWSYESTQFPPERIVLRALGHTVAFVFVAENFTTMPGQIEPYYITEGYIPQGVLAEFGKKASLVDSRPKASHMTAPICEIYSADAEALAKELGVRVPTITEWGNAREGKKINPQGTKELASMKMDSGWVFVDIDPQPVADISNSPFATKAQFYIVNEKKAIPKGCLRLVVSLSTVRSELK